MLPTISMLEESQTNLEFYFYSDALVCVSWARIEEKMDGENAGFGKGEICVGEIQAIQVSSIEKVWSTTKGGIDNKGATFYRPVQLPQGYFIIGHLAQSNAEQPYDAILVAVKENLDCQDNISKGDISSSLPPLAKPLDYVLVWSSESWDGTQGDGVHGYFWVPQPPQDYKALGCLVTNTPSKPTSEDLVVCVRSDLTDACETDGLIWSTQDNNNPFGTWNTRPQVRGIKATGVYVSTFYCQAQGSPDATLPIACLKNSNLDKFSAMPNLEEVQHLLLTYGPTVFLHPDEKYMASSVEWFFQNGALLYSKDSTIPPQAIDPTGSNLPQGGDPNDGAYWLDLPKDDKAADRVKKGDLQSAEGFVHIKPMLGGTCTDMSIWLFYPFNGSRTLKAGVLNIHLRKIGEHVGDWEHFTLRFSNFTGKLWRVYLSQHSGGQWLNPSDMEYIQGSSTRSVIYSAKDSHANYSRAGDFLQGDTKLGIGLRNDTAKSKNTVDTSTKYQIISMEYLKVESVQEPPWLQYMRHWGPSVTYDTKAELERILKFLPSKLRHAIEKFFNDDLPSELSHEEGPTGPKAKNSWEGDEK